MAPRLDAIVARCLEKDPAARYGSGTELAAALAEVVQPAAQRPLRPSPYGTDPVDFLPRFKIPVPLREGRNDFIFPYTTAQLPLFRLLGTPARDKKMMLSDLGHIVAWPAEMMREALNWLDRYLGPLP